MIKLNRKNILISLICSAVFLAVSIVLFVFFQEKSNLISYSSNKKEIKIYMFDKISKKNSNQIQLSDADPKDFILNRNINENTDVIFTYDKNNKKVIISTVDDNIQINKDSNKLDSGLVLKEIDANIGDSLIFGSNNIEVKEGLKNVYKIKDFINNLEVKQNIDFTKKENLLKGQNYSFESGTWGKTIDLCQKGNDKPSSFSQKILSNCTDGKKCLLLSSENNTGCTSSLFNVDLNKELTYNISFDYKQLKKNSRSSFFITLISSSGQMYYYASDLTASDSFKRFQYDFTIKENIVAIITKLSITGESGNESSMMFDNFKIVESSKNKILDINKGQILKDFSFGKISLKNGLNEFRATPKIDSELSSNYFDYFLTFENKYQGSSFIKKIQAQEIISRLSIFVIFISSIVLLLSILYLLKDYIIKCFNVVIAKLLSFINIVIKYPGDKLSEIKREKPLFIILKILIMIIIFAFYIHSVSTKKDINVLSLIALFYGVNSILFIIESRISAAVALIYLSLCPILLILKKDNIAEDMAVQAYYFLIITVITQIRESRKEEKDKITKLKTMF